MNVFDNKQLLVLAINSYDFYTERQKKLLSLLVHMSIDGVATVSTTYLKNYVALSRAGIYLNLKKFTTEGMLSKIRKPADNQDSYCLNKEKLEHIVQLYHNKQSAHSIK
jgi:Fe2+ or Zn2+ uptake regulation protein